MNGAGPMMGWGILFGTILGFVAILVWLFS
jgi:hypothetical protein